MIAIDTNILVRIFVEDASQTSQVHAARNFAKKHAQLYIPVTVQVELVWVLDFAYKFQKSQIITILKHLDENDAFILQNQDQFSEALNLFENYSADFADCLISLEAKAASCTLFTFDKRFSKLPHVKLI